MGCCLCLESTCVRETTRLLNARSLARSSREKYPSTNPPNREKDDLMHMMASLVDWRLEGCPTLISNGVIVRYSAVYSYCE
ncbi:hypothetical protein Mapa_007730 [Marchantia paleacea]|nr:hypothetical protein Mapa_007730 [Marchantia paleacea]